VTNSTLLTFQQAFNLPYLPSIVQSSEIFGLLR